MDRPAGTGPDEITPDGCAVDFYALLPPMGEPEIVHAAVPAGASILELGCGTGRRLRPLAALGHPVLGVDESPALRREFLATCRHHAAPGGVVVIQQNPPGWFDTTQPSERVVGDIRRVVRSARREGPRLHLLTEYHVGDRVWTHAWGSYLIGDQELRADLASAGLEFGRWLTGDHAWFTAHPADAS